MLDPIDAATLEWKSEADLFNHLQRHRELGYVTLADYEASSRRTIQAGKQFTYIDRSTGKRRIGFFDPATELFTGVELDPLRIVTHFRTQERKVRQWRESTYQ